MWDFQTDPEFEEKLAWMREFVRDEIWPLETVVADVGEAPFHAHLRSLQDRVKQQGLWATHLPPDLGGQGFGQIKLALMHEIEGTVARWGPTVFGNQAPDSGNSEILAMFGSDEQKDRWLYPLLSGDIRSAFSMTEPFNAGSDPANMSTTARREGDEWVLDGHKWFTSNGMIAELLIVMAITDHEAEPHRRASMFLVPSDAHGVDRLRNIPTLAGDEHFGYGHAEILYLNVRIPADSLLGEVGGGFAIAQSRLGPGRIHHCMRWIGQMQRAFDMLCERALQRETSSGPLASKQTVQNWIADSLAEIQAARLLTIHAAWMIDMHGVKAARREISLIKFWGSQTLHNVIDRAIQIHGSLGYSDDLPLANMYRFARAARLYDGPDEVHRETVARLVLRDYEAPGTLWPREHVPTRRLAAVEKFRSEGVFDL